MSPKSAKRSSPPFDRTQGLRINYNLPEIENRLEKFIYEVENESRLVRAGLKEKAETVKIYQKYKDLFSREVLEVVKNQIDQTRGSSSLFGGSSDSRRNREVRLEILERIYFTLVSGIIGFKTANLDDAIKTYFSKAKVKIDSEELAYFQLSPKIAKEPIFIKREKYDDSAEKVIVKINPKQLAVLQEEIRILKSLGFSGYLNYYSQAKKVDYADFFQIVQKIKKETDNLWEKTMSKVSQEIFGKPFKNIRACHLLYLRSMSLYDNFYPKEKVVAVFLEFTKGLGLFDLLSTVNIDDKNRPSKNPRAWCSWPKPPEEVHLQIKPIGGEQDFEAMLHEGGHALHGAGIFKSLPFAFRNISRSNALTETYAFILEDLVFDPLWLSSFLNVSAYTAERIKKHAYFVNLMLLRRYLGKFSYEYEMFSKAELFKGPSLYAKNLQSTTGFVSQKTNWLWDMDSGFYSADYLRAWIGAAQLKDCLTSRFGKEWFLNRKAGTFLRNLFSKGLQDELEEVVARMGYKPFDISFLIKGYKEVLD